jgi:hypothetical protein
MHIYNWYQSIATVILLCTQTQITIYMAHSPCFLSPLAGSLLLPLPTPFYLLGTLLAMTGSVHHGLRLLVNWPPLSQPFPQSLPLQIPRTQVTQSLTKTTLRRIWRLLSGTICYRHCDPSYLYLEYLYPHTVIQTVDIEYTKCGQALSVCVQPVPSICKRN